MSIWDRVGAIFDSAKETLSREVPSPVGTIVNLASTLSSPSRVASDVVMPAWKKAGEAFFKTTAGQKTQEVAGQGLTWLERNVWSPPTDAVEAQIRQAGDAGSTEQMFRGIAGAFVPGAQFAQPLGVLDPEFRDEYWPEARANDSSIMQTLWELDRAGTAAPNAGFHDPTTGKWELPLIDDPELRHEREQYFDRGAQKWVTGIGDASLSMVLDPVNVVTGGIGAGVKGLTRLTGKSIGEAGSASRGADLLDEASVLRGEAGTDEVAKGSVAMGDDSFMNLADDAPRAFLRKDLGDERMQSLWDETVEVLGTPGDKTSALESTLGKYGIDTTKVLDDARYAKGDGKLTPEAVLSSAGEDLMDKKGIKALFEPGQEQPFYRRGLENQDMTVNNLGLNARRYKSNVEKLTDYAWSSQGAPGTVARLSDDYVLGQSSDTGAIADAMSWVAATVGDEKVAKGVMDDLQYAAAGDGGALRRLEAFNTKMALDVEAMASLDRTAALDAIKASPLKTPAEKLAIANDDDLFVRMREAAEPELTAFVSKFGQFQSSVARVQAAGTLGGVAPGGLKAAGDITKIPLMGTFQPFRSLPPVRILGGTHVPGRMNLDDPEAANIYDKWLEKNTTALGLNRREADLELTNTFRDAFSASANESVDRGLSLGARSNAVFRANQALKKEVVRRHAAKHGVDRDEIELWIDTALDIRQTELGAIVQGARASAESGSAVMTRLPGGEIVATTPEASQALGTSQFQEAAELTDWAEVDKWLDKRYKPGYTERVVQGTDETPGPGGLAKTREVTTELLEEANDAWKVLALARVAYPIRVQVDTQARNLSTMGALRSMEFLFKGVGNSFRNTKLIDRQVVELAQRKRHAYDEMAVILERSENDERIAELQKIVDMDLDTWKASGLSTVEPGQIRRRKTELRAFTGKGEKVNVKTGGYERDATATYQPGQSPESVLGEGVQESIEGLYKSADAFYQKKLRKKLGYNYTDYGTSPATRRAWTKGYLEAVNHGIRNDASWGRMLAGADDDSIIDWMRRDPEGKAYFGELNRSAHFSGPEELVGRQRSHFDNLIPDRDKADIVSARDITAEDLADWWSGSGQTRPYVPTQVFETLKHGDRTTPYDVYDASRSKYFKFVAQMPETYMGRHPQYHRFYQDHMQRFIAASGRDKGDLSLAEINELRKRADGQSRKDMAKIMFDTSHKSNAGHHLRFISPFFSAWEDTMFKWSTIAKENPTATYNTLVRPFESLTSANNVYDGEGNRIMPNGEKRRVNEDGSLGDVVGHSTSINEGYFFFTLPDWMTPGEGEQDFRLSRGSLNAIFQGEDWWSPGTGPMVQIPANEVVKSAFPELGDTPIGDFVLPYDATSENLAAQAAPAHAKHATNWIGSLLGNESSESFQDTFNLAMQDEIIRQRESGERLSEKETRKRVTKTTRNLLLLKWIGSGAMPASTRPESRLDWYRKEYQRYQAADPKEALKRFAADYPEFTEVTISLRDNATGISATEEANNAADPWKSEIEVNPEIGWAMAGPDNYKGDFNRNVYTNQTAKGWRVREDAGETFDRINISRGWQDWMTLSNIIDTELDKRGLTSITSKGAEDLVALKNEAKAEIMADNPSWAEEYVAGGGGADKAVDFLNKMNGAMSRNPAKAEKRQDLQILNQYMSDRELARQTMAEYGVSSLPTEEELAEYIAGDRNGDEIRFAIAHEWYRATAEYKNDSPVFADMYSRAGLERDTLTNPVVVG